MHLTKWEIRYIGEIHEFSFRCVHEMEVEYSVGNKHIGLTTCTHTSKQFTDIYSFNIK